MIGGCERGGTSFRGLACVLQRLIALGPQLLVHLLPSTGRPTDTVSEHVGGFGIFPCRIKDCLI